jgi:hypothetical protein
MQENVWGDLSVSSKKALRWSAAVARLRADRAGRPVEGVEADEFDLLVGTMLAHPRDSEARQLLAHVGASAADVLPPDYPVPGDDLEQYGAEVPANDPPELTDPADEAVGIGAELRGGDKVVELRALFGGLLLGSNLVAEAFRLLLSKVGLTGVAETYREYVGSSRPGSYAAFLAERHPFHAEPVAIPNYKADQVVVGEDLVDIHAEVDAFAYLLASRSLKPPLAVGLFGDWGSGKTYFMETVRDRIAQLVASRDVLETPQAALPFWKQIVQIDFNAWHYVGGDLWASLVEHVFSELRAGRDEDDSRLVMRQKHWLKQIEDRRKQRAEVTGQIDTKRKQKNAAQRALVKAEEHKQQEEERLEQARADAVTDIVLKDSQDQARKALADFADRATDGHASQTLAAIEDARAQLRRGTAAIGGYEWNRRRTIVAVGALVAVPLLVFALDRIGTIPATAQVFAGVSAALALMTAGLRVVTGWTKERLDALEEAEAAVRDEIESQRQTLQAEVDAAVRSVADANAEVESLTTQDRDLAREIAVLEVRAKSVTSRQILGEFVAERVGSSDYRKLLGTTALIQRDFDELSRLIAEQNDELLVTDTGEKPPAPETINRIILYIDDLDRCEPDRVIEVLQAVHLLLAFPLFVVVVAVDSRWLANSLAEHYPALAAPAQPGATPASATDGTRDGADHARPSDYLEKIFQVPFWIEPLDDATRKTLVRGLLQGNLAPATGRDEPPEDAEPLRFEADSGLMVYEMFGKARAVRLQTAAMSVTPHELTYLYELAPLLGDTPRSIKRFVNVYQLLRALPVPPGLGSPLYEETAGFLLALTDGLPELYAALDRALEQDTPGATLADALETVRPTLSAEELERYDAWAEHHPHVVGTSAELFAETARRVRRFTFH